MMKPLRLLIVMLLVVSIDFNVIRLLDHLVFVWPGHAAPLVFPFWASLPKFTYYLIVGYIAGRLLRLTPPGAAAFLLVILAYFAVFRFGTYYLYGGFLSYFSAYLPIASIPIAYMIGYAIGRYGKAIRSFAENGLRTELGALRTNRSGRPTMNERAREVGEVSSALNAVKTKPLFRVTLFVLLALCIDFILVGTLDRLAYLWPGRTSPLIFPLWASLPRFAYYLIVGYVVGSRLKLTIAGAGCLLALILAYYAIFRIGTYSVDGQLLAYTIVFLPIASIPLAYAAGYAIGKYGTEIRRVFAKGL